MRFETDEKIRVMNRIGSQQVDTLNYGTYLRPANDPGHLVVECLGKECEVPSINCYSWTPAPDCDKIMGEWALERMPEIIGFITEGLKALVNVEVVVTTQDNNEQGIPCIQLDGMTVSVEPCRMIHKCLGRYTEAFGWSCTTYHSINNCPSVPDDVEDVEYGREMNTLGIAQMAVRAIGECIADNYWTHMSECQMAEELQLDQK